MKQAKLEKYQKIKCVNKKLNEFVNLKRYYRVFRIRINNNN